MQLYSSKMNRKSRYHEELARSILQIYVPDICSHLLLDDIPDLQDPSGAIGIEVVRAVSDGEADAFFYKNLNKTVEEISERGLNKFEKLGAHPIIYKGRLGGAEYPAHWSWEVTLAAIVNKIFILNKGHYHEFEKYGLFVFSKDADCETIDWLKGEIKELQKDVPKKFDFVFIYHEPYRLFVMDLLKDVLEKIDLPENDISKVYQALSSFQDIN